MTGIFNSLPIRVGIEVGQSNIKTNSLTRWFSLVYAFLIEAKLDIVPVGPTHNAHPLNLLQLIKVQVTSSHNLRLPASKPSVKVMVLLSNESFQPVVLYSTEPCV